MAKQDAAVCEMEKKHRNEQDALLDLVQRVESEPVALEAASKLPADERKEKLGLMGIKRKQLKEKTKALVGSQIDENQMSEVSIEIYL